MSREPAQNYHILILNQLRRPGNPRLRKVPKLVRDDFSWPWGFRKKVKCCGPAPGVLLLPRQGHSWGTARTARGHYRGALGVTTGVSWVLPRGYYRGHSPGSTWPSPGAGSPLWPAANFCAPTALYLRSRSCPREGPDLVRPVHRPVRTGRCGFSDGRCGTLRIFRLALRSVSRTRVQVGV
jgi:hypothetical protein